MRPLIFFIAHLCVHSFSGGTDAAAFEVVGKFGEGNCVLRIRRDFAYEYRPLHRFFVSHDEDVRHGERAGCRYLLGHALVPGALIPRYWGAPKFLKTPEDPAARLAS